MSMDIFSLLPANLNISEMMNILPGNIYIKDKEGKYIWCNEENAKWFGRSSSQDIIGKNDYDFFSKEEADILRKVDTEVMRKKTELIVEEPGTDKDGKQHIYLSKKRPLFNTKGDLIGIIGTSFDLSEYKEHLNNILKIKTQSDQTLQEIISLMPGHIYWKDRLGRFIGCNDAQAKTLGFSKAADLIGKTVYETLPKEQADVINHTDMAIMKNDQPYVIEEISNTFEGKEAVYISQKSPLHDPSGKVIGILGISVEITEQKKVQEALKKAQGQIDGMTLVSASIAHELRTPLAGVKSALYCINSYLPKLIQAYYQALSHQLDVPILHESALQDLSDATASINKKIDHSNMVIDMLLTNLAHDQINTQDFSLCSILDTVRQAIEKYTFPIGQKKLVEVNIKQDFIFSGKPVLIIHILFNLLKNALYFIQKARKGDIQIWIESGEQSNFLHFKDTSQGIPSDVLPHIFDQFFSKGTHHGTGIGLAFSKMVMRAHGGDITCESVLGEYTDFILRFPLPPK